MTSVADNDLNHVKETNFVVTLPGNGVGTTCRYIQPKSQSSGDSFRKALFGPVSSSRPGWCSRVTPVAHTRQRLGSRIITPQAIILGGRTVLLNSSPARDMCHEDDARECHLLPRHMISEGRVTVKVGYCTLSPVASHLCNSFGPSAEMGTELMMDDLPAHNSAPSTPTMTITFKATGIGFQTPA